LGLEPATFQLVAYCLNHYTTKTVKLVKQYIHDFGVNINYLASPQDFLTAFWNNPKDGNCNACEMLENIYIKMLLDLKKHIKKTIFLLNVDKMATNSNCGYSFGI
jgi:hypothetical protein